MARLGFDTLCDIGKETTYGSEASSFDAIPILSESLTPELDQVRAEILNRGKLTTQYDTSGLRRVTGSIEGLLYFDTSDTEGKLAGLGILLELVLGGEASGSGEHTYYPAKTLPSGTLRLKPKSGSSAKFLGVKANTLTISGEKGAELRYSVEVVGREHVSGDTPSTLPTTLVPITFMDLTVGIGGTEVNPDSFELTINNNLITDMYANSDKMLEPERNGWLEVSLRVHFPRITSTEETLIGYAENHTPKDVTIIASRTVGGYTYSFEIFLKDVIFHAYTDHVGSPGVVPLELTGTPIAIAEGQSDFYIKYSKVSST